MDDGKTGSKPVNEGSTKGGSDTPLTQPRSGPVRRAGAQVTRFGALDMQVCVPAEWTDEQVKSFADSRNLCGTEHGWQIRREGDKALAGCAERVQCQDDPSFVHIMLDA
jgi:hypothetical protein